MNIPDEFKVRLYTHAADLFKAHEKLLIDAPRNRAFYKALKKRVTPDSVVLDIGSGTGIWAIAAALLGAKRVVAVERDPLLIGLIRSLAHENGVADKIETIAADSRQVQLDKEFDIVVSEMIGHLAYEEQLIPILTDARDRFLKPGGVLIPDSVSLVVAGAHLKTRHPRLPAGIPVRYERFESLNLNVPIGMDDGLKLKLLTKPRELARADLLTIENELDLSDLTASWQMDDVSRLNSFAVWVESIMTEGVRHSTLRASHWKPVIYRMRPFADQGGEVEFRLALTATGNDWKVALANEQGQEKQSYSLAYTGSMLLALSRTSADLLGGPYGNTSMPMIETQAGNRD